MKKLIVGLVTALSMSFGLVAFTGAVSSPANAADCKNYPGQCTDTRVPTPTGPKVKKAVGKPKKAVFSYTVNVQSVGASTTPAGGEFYVQIIGPNRVWFIKEPARGGNATFTTPRLKPGTYTVRVRYNAKSGGNYNTSAFKVYTIRVN